MMHTVTPESTRREALRDAVTPSGDAATEDVVTRDAKPAGDEASGPVTSDDEARWAAVCGRDVAADGRFVFAVTSTGIYCRPVCPARRPARRRVRFFDDWSAAERAGFRACRRCDPRGPSRRERHLAVVRRACALIAAAETPPRLDALAAEAGVSPFHFHRLFRSITGVTPRRYAAAKRIERLRERLAGGAPGSVTDAIYDAGFGSSSRAYAQTARELGMTPTRFKAGGAGSVIRFATVPTRLGVLLVAATDVGICAATFGETSDAVRSELAARFPRAQIVEAEPAACEWVASIAAHVDRATSDSLAHLPVDVQGTAFQERVWRALRAIPAGETRTYSQLAREVGRPGAARAVGRACGENRVAIIVPCHRAVRGDGALGGYRWGVERKRALLAQEGATVAPRRRR